MIIEIDDDMVDSIIQKALVQNYIFLMNDIKIHNKTGTHLHEEDFEAYVEVAAAVEVLGNWYFVSGEFQKAVKAARKKL
tara:strand:+ start:1160 stop:1396 length:237 start_codon:yes stop_codon:yes gene_type:complete